MYIYKWRSLKPDRVDHIVALCREAIITEVYRRAWMCWYRSAHPSRVHRKNLARSDCSEPKAPRAPNGDTTATRHITGADRLIAHRLANIVSTVLSCREVQAFTGHRLMWISYCTFQSAWTKSEPVEEDWQCIILAPCTIANEVWDGLIKIRSNSFCSFPKWTSSFLASQLLRDKSYKRLVRPPM